MDGDLITVEVLINGVLFKPVFIDIDCECYFIVDENFITELWLPRVKIPLKPIIGFVKENIMEPLVEIIEIVKFSIDIQRYRRNIFTYVVPVLLNPVIMGLPWIRKDNIIIKPVTNTLIINSYSLIISIKETPVSLKIKKLIGKPFAILIKGVRKCQKPLIILKVLLKDITKVLHLKIKRIPAEIRKLLPAQYYNYLRFFEGHITTELPPHRPNINHTFTLEKNKNG